MNDRDTIEVLEYDYPINTYIIITDNKEYYCGKTTNLNRRMKEHLNKDGWFAFNNRHKFSKYYVMKDNFEKEIKRFGVKRFLMLCELNKLKLYEVSLS